MTPAAEIISIGDELLYGQIINTNAQWMGAELDKIGVRIKRMTTVADEEGEILKSFAEAEARADIILITGGLGPTEDDLTKPCLAKYFNCKMSLHPEALADIQLIYKQIGKELDEVNQRQAILPEGCEKITNRRGTASGMWFQKGKKVFVSMPGVPGEMRHIMVEGVIPRLQKEFSTDVIFHKVVKTVGIGETWLSETINPWAKALPPHIRLAYLPDLGQVKLRLTGVGEDRKKLKDEVEGQVSRLLPYINKYVYGFDAETLEEAIGKLLIERGKTIAVAESCTGGYISHLITSIAGSSAYFRGSVIPYHNDLKENFLNVGHQTLLDHGAVSEQIVVEMAEAVREKFGADIGLASSGIAGPTGGTPEKPVGTIWIACTDGSTTKTRKLQFFKDRMMNIESTGVAALNLVRLSLLQTVEIN